MSFLKGLGSVAKRTAKSKTLVLVVAVVIVFTNLCIGSYAWYTTNQTIVNPFEGTEPLKLDITVSEIFIPPDKWRPNQTVIKDVKIGNIGDYMGIVRVSLSDALMLYDIDLETGNLVTELANGRTVTDESDLSTWQVGNISPARYVTSSGSYAPLTDGTNQLYYVVRDVPTTTNISFVEADRNQEIAKSVTINWGSSVGLEVGKDWIFDQSTGYFYYTKILQPGQQTSSLFTSVTMKATSPNSHKGGVYKLSVHADGVQPYLDVLDSYWGLSTSSAAYTALASILW